MERLVAARVRRRGESIVCEGRGERGRYIVEVWCGLLRTDPLFLLELKWDMDHHPARLCWRLAIGAVAMVTLLDVSSLFDDSASMCMRPKTRGWEWQRSGGLSGCRERPS